MKKIILLISLLILSSLLFTNVVTAKEYTPKFEEEAETLKELGLFKGTNNGFELNRQPTRLEALMMLLRMLGLEEEAGAETSAIPFQDVNDWWKPYVAYAYKNKLTLGYDDITFGSNDYANEKMFVTFVLRSLGYSDSDTTDADFTYEKAVEKALEIGLLTDDYLENKPEELMRDGCVAISTQALKTKLKDKNEILLSKLLERGAVEESKTKKILSEAAYYALLAEKAYQKRQVATAEEYYLKAVELDPLQAKYQVSLAEIYAWMVKTSKTTTEQSEWIAKQRSAIEQAVKLASQDSEYVKELMIFYFDHEDYKNALQQAERNFLLTKKQEEAYEWLARGYNEYGIELLQEGKVEEGKALLEKAIELLNVKSLSNNKIVMFYAGKSYLAFGKFEEAETLLQKARANQNLRSHSDWLLYLINEETGRSTENEKYKGVIWMGSVIMEPKTNTKYLEMKSILDSKLLT